MKRIVVVVLALTASGCVTLGSMQTASTLGAGNFQGAAELNVEGAFFLGDYARVVGTGSIFFPTVNFAFRYGATDYFDIGVKIGSTLIELQTKFMFTSPDSNFVVSLAPSITGFFFGIGNTTVGAVAIPVPVLIGFKFGDHELVLGPRVMNQIVFGGTTGSGGGSVGGYGFGLGASVGIALRLADSFMLMPEIAFQVPLFATAAASNGASASAFSQGEVLVTFGIGAIFGKMKPRGGAQPPPPPPPQDDRPPPPPPPSDVPPPPPPPPPSSN